MSDELERLAAACLLPSFPGPNAPDWVKRWIERGLGGVVLFAGNIRDSEQIQALTAELHAERRELLVATDEEGGDVTRLEAARGSSYPGNLALGTVDDTGLTSKVAAAIATDLRAAGITMNLAPVADVNTNPRNPVIGVRAFGSDARLVARHVAAFVEGTQRCGVLACAKHFPGHGDTHADSHLELPTVDASREELEAVALVPFRAAVEADVVAVMTAHVVVRSVDTAPATLSPAVVTGLLREELAFDGLVLTDALDMRAVAAGASPAELGVRALGAGVDLVCLGPAHGPDAVVAIHAGIVAAVHGGRLSAARVAEAAGRVERVSKLAGAVGHPRADVAGDVGREAAVRAARAEGDIVLDGAPLVVELVPEPLAAAGRSAHSLGSVARERWPDTDVVPLSAAPPELQPLLGRAANRPLVLVVHDPARHAWQREVASALVSARPDMVIIDVSIPGELPSGTRACVKTFGAGRVNFEAAIDLLAGELPATKSSAARERGRS